MVKNMLAGMKDFLLVYQVPKMHSNQHTINEQTMKDHPGLTTKKTLRHFLDNISTGLLDMW